MSAQNGATTLFGYQVVILIFPGAGMHDDGCVRCDRPRRQQVRGRPECSSRGVPKDSFGSDVDPDVASRPVQRRRQDRFRFAQSDGAAR